MRAGRDRVGHTGAQGRKISVRRCQPERPLERLQRDRDQVLCDFLAADPRLPRVASVPQHPHHEQIEHDAGGKHDQHKPFHLVSIARATAA